MPEKVREFDPSVFYPKEDEMKRRLAGHPARDEILTYLQKHGGHEGLIPGWGKEKRGVLSDLGILQHLVAGNIIIQPFDHRLLQPHGYDVRLGEYYYRLKDWRDGVDWLAVLALVHLFRYMPGYNPYSERDVKNLWQGPLRTKAARRPTFEPKNLWERVTYSSFKIDRVVDALGRFPDYDNVGDGDLIIPMRPGEMLLGHTQEFIGGRNVVSTRISGRSSIGRNMVEVCSDANLGVTGFFDRWTLELANKSNTRRISLLVGEPVATIQFEEMGSGLASYGGSYQRSEDSCELFKNWSPESMLPRLKRLK